MKKLLLFTLALLFSLSLVHAAEFYQAYELNFSDDIPQELFVSGGECTEATCESFKNTNIEVYEAEAVTCLNQALNGTIGVTAFENCVAQEIATDKIIEINESTRPHLLVTKVGLPAQFGHLVYFSTKGDTYLPLADRITNYQCDFDICIDTDLPQLNFVKKDGAIAEIQQVNIVNTEDPNKPIQVEVPVEIEETVCSAFQFSNPNFARVSIPEGFSDFSADTQISLEIFNEDTQEFLFEEFVTLPIQADLCADIAAFNFTPQSNLEGDELTFRVETDISDRQVINGRQDFHEVTETLFSQDLDGACFVRAFDFTLSNVPDFELTSSTAQITEGESLFAGFRAQGLKDNSLDSIPFEAKIFIDNEQVFNQRFGAVNELTDIFVNLSDISKDLPVGNHEVILVVEPRGENCLIEEDVIQIQNLEIQELETFTVNFFLRDLNGTAVEDSNVTLTLLEDIDFFVEELEFAETQTSNAQGQAQFTEVPPGEYRFDINASRNFTDVSGNVRIASDTDLFITLDNENQAPVIDLPDELRGDFSQELSLELRDFVFDPNDAFEDLSFSIETFGNIAVSFNGEIVTFSASSPQNAQAQIFVQDPQGAQASDTMDIIFIDNGAPVIETFEADPTNGAAPLETEFTIEVEDENVPALICTLDFGDGTSVRDSCLDLDGTIHTYEISGTFIAELRVDDGENVPTIAQEEIFVFNEIDEFPVIENFDLESSNGIFVPTNLTLSWEVSHTGNFPTVCELIINNDLQVVNCNDSLRIENFERTGLSVFTLRAIDNQSFKVEETIRETFREEAQELGDINAELIIDEEIFGNEIDFAIDVGNELEIKRQIKVQPRIVCDGATAKVSNTQDGFLSTSIRSRTESPAGGVFEFSLEKRDFNLLLPEDELCTFEVLLRDEFGQELLLSEGIIFRDLDDLDDGKVPSIRGHGSDILSYMLSALQDMKPGFNLISFRIENHHEEGREFTMTLISRELGIDTTVVKKIGSDEDQEIQVPVFISDRYEAGMYPARISVYDEEQRQTRYTYIKVTE